MTRVVCPFHEEKTPSCVIYPEHYHCYGCNASGPLSDLNPNLVPKVIDAVEPENLEKAFAYITQLPTKEIRGHTFHYDDRGYYLTWDNQAYYKKRFFDAAEGPKYLGASGHKRPLFWARREGNENLILVEGELNALSIAKALPGIDVASPGGAGDFSTKRMRRMLTEYEICSTVLIVADKDAPGTEAVINGVSELRASGREAMGILMAEDANDLLQRVGVIGLREQLVGQIERAVASESRKRNLSR